MNTKRDGTAVSFGRQGVFCTISITGNGKKTEIFHKKAGQTVRLCYNLTIRRGTSAFAF